MRRLDPPARPTMTLQELGLAITSKAGCSPLLGQHVARTLLDEFNDMLAAGYQLGIPQLCQSDRPGFTYWRLDIKNPRDGFAGAVIFRIPTVH